MTGPLPPDEQARVQKLLRERDGDPADVEAERFRPIPEPPGRPVPPRKRGAPLLVTPYPTRANHAAEHAAMREWVRRTSMEWAPELYTLGDNEAHVVIKREPRRALGLCGADGVPHLAPDLARVCSVCRSFRR